MASIIRTAEKLNSNEEFDTLELSVLYKKLPQDIKDQILKPYVLIDKNQARISLRVIDTHPELKRANFVNELREHMDSNRWLTRIIVLETVAGVPGMVAGMWSHLRSLRKMKPDDRGWIRTLLAEAENERMHLMIFIQIAKPNWFERWMIITAQFIFWHFYMFLYIFFPKVAPIQPWLLQFGEKFDRFFLPSIAVQEQSPRIAVEQDLLAPP